MIIFMIKHDINSVLKSSILFSQHTSIQTNKPFDTSVLKKICYIFYSINLCCNLLLCNLLLHHNNVQRTFINITTLLPHSSRDKPHCVRNDDAIHGITSSRIVLELLIPKHDSLEDVHRGVMCQDTTAVGEEHCLETSEAEQR